MNRVRTFGVLCLTLGLAACGGGNSSTPAPLNSATCDSNALWAVPQSSNPLGIPENDPAGISVTWNNQNCALQSVTSAALEICLNHTSPSDLAWTIASPTSGSAAPFTAPSNWNTTGSSCATGAGKLQQINILSAVQSTAGAHGLWTLNVSDRSPGNTGTLVQWRVIVGGLR